MVAINLLKRITTQYRSKTASLWLLWGEKSSLYNQYFCFFSTSKCSLSTSRCWCKNVQDDSKPIRYTTSAAKQWQSIKTFEIPEHMKKMPPYQPYSVILSVLAILLYFGVLREENDMDELLGLSLYERMPGLEEKNIRIAIDYEKSLGRSTTELERRLVDLEQTGSG
ncbi:hypothetical protein LSH36_6g03000 [Paralvinella palmiformis]|uniref:Uncharacterized protein n=1 Tax=Paralvinella palmiformis TaxID=53620 RepID=A0AAD9KES5_9ANNE|nr:hypothetical protein LSH36_6g03000 [Paralvinella palmiformis]